MSTPTRRPRASRSSPSGVPRRGLSGGLRGSLPASLRGRLLVLGGLALLGATALVAFLIATEYRTQMEGARAEVLDRAEGVGMQAAEMLRGAQEVAQRLAIHPSVLGGDASACVPWIREAAALLPHLADLQAFTLEGTLLCSARGLVGEVGEMDRDVVPPIQVSAVGAGGEWVVPVRSRAGVGGVEARVLLRTRALSGFLTSVATRPGEILTLADSSGFAVARSANPELWVGRNLLTTGVVEPPSDPRGTFESPGADGAARIWGYVRIPDTPWILLAGFPTEAVVAPVRSTAIRQGVSLLVLSTLFGLLLLGAERTLRQALARVGVGAEEAQERLGVRLPEEGPEEVAKLARTLNRTLVARDAAERDLAGMLERHELVLRASRDMIWDWDLVDRRLHTNDALRRFLGDAEALATSPQAWVSRIPEPDRSRVRTALETTLEGGGTVWIQEYPVAGLDGGRLQLLDRGYVVRSETGAAIRMVGVLSDVTEARRRTDEVRRTKERYESILRNAPFAVFLCSEEGQLIEWNPALETVLGERWEGKPPRRQVPGFFANTAHFQDFALEARRRGVVIGREAIWKKADGTEIFVRLTLTTFEEGGERRLEALAEDVTDRRRLGEQVRHSQKMEAVGRLAGGVAHDFNNLLTVISGESRILLGDTGLDPDARESAEAILEAGERGSALTRQLLAFSRRQVVDLSPVKVNTVVEGAERMLSRLLGEQVRFRTHLAPELPPVVADAGELEQVLLNLAVNARDAMPEGGELVVRTWVRTLPPGELDQHPGLGAGEYVMISVSDQGCGIDHAIVSRIFEPFFTTKAVGKGTGLGLSMVYGIVSRLGGKVEVETEPGAGSTFHLFLPAATEGAGSPPRTALTSPRALGGDGRVLVVEDEDGVRRMALRILERAGYEVVTYGEPREVLERVRAGSEPRPHLLLTDVRMPGMHGNALADQVRQIWPDLPVLYMSGYPEEASIAERIRRRDADFLAKPFTPEALLNAVRHLLNVNSAAIPGTPTDRALGR